MQLLKPKKDLELARIGYDPTRGDGKLETAQTLPDCFADWGEFYQILLVAMANSIGYIAATVSEDDKESEEKLCKIVMDSLNTGLEIGRKRIAAEKKSPLQ